MLGIRYRYKDSDGHYVCGPFVYMERGLGIKGMGILYSFLCLMCSLGMGSMVQANSAISTMEYTWKVPVLTGGLVFTGVLMLVICGGIKRIGNVAEKLMPAASGIYIVFSLIVIFSCYGRIPGAGIHGVIRVPPRGSRGRGSRVRGKPQHPLRHFQGGVLQ